jgi:hypothetical protein
LKARALDEDAWVEHSLIAQGGLIREDDDDLASLEEDSFYGKSARRKRRLEPANTKKRKPKKKRLQGFLDQEPDSEDDMDISDSSCSEEEYSVQKRPKKKARKE